MSLRFDPYRGLIVTGIVLHFAVGFAAWWYLRGRGGVLEGSDEVRYLWASQALADFWRQGLWPHWSSWYASDANFGYYHLLGIINLAGISGSGLPRMLNVVLGLTAILLWWRALAINGEGRAVQRLFIALAIFVPSVMLMTSLVLKEAMIYALIAAHMALVARCLATGARTPMNLFGLCAVLLVLSYFRSYIALLLWGLATPFMAWRLGFRTAAIYCLAAAAAMVVLNPYLLNLLARFLIGENLYVRVLDWLLGEGPLIVTSAAISGAELFALVTTENSVGGSAIDPATPLYIKLWLFVTFPLPWQARSALQWFAVPEVLAFLCLLPVAVHGFYVKLKARDVLALYVAAYILVSLAIYLVYATNLGTLYRYKALLMFPFAYFIAVGLEQIWLRTRSGSTSSGERP
ncbi:MAG: hypothetical protein A3K04_03300 [Gallionellales bacterium RBG_16_56_9]|nr:MAG: hypothetical protein A3K04_03300 [Gallionellales bacterium RBG_16_56_9]